MLILKGEKVADKTRHYTKKDGSQGSIREIAVNEGYLTNTIIQVPLNAKIEVDAKNNIMLSGVRVVGKKWNPSLNKFDFCPLSYYLPDDKNS